MLRRILPLVLAAVTGCSGNSNPPGLSGDTGTDHNDPNDPFFANLKQGIDQLGALCARGHQDSVARGICAAKTPSVTSLVDLQHVIGLFDGAQPPQFALLGHSTSLIAREISAINPRAIVFTAPSAAPTTQQNDGTFVQDPGFVIQAFARGDQFVELAAHDAQKDELNFYLVRFTHKCNESKAGCAPGDLLTPSVESGWRTVTVYDDEDLKNTVFDCRACHQSDGPGTRKILRMQERRSPWTHWFRNNKNEPGGVALLQDFQAAHGTDEDYAGIPADLISTPRSDPLVFEALVDNNSLSPQPNEFNGSRIEREMAQGGQSPTWSQLYQNYLSGQDIPVPYHDIRVTDPTKLSAMTDAYRAALAGQKPVASLPDIRNVLDDNGLADMGFRPQPGSTGQSILVQMCTRCHNDRLDPSLSRAHFDVTQLATMSAGQKMQAINRLQMPKDSPLVMPPVRAAELSADEIQAAVQALSQ
jgi:cytochrome c553